MRYVVAKLLLGLAGCSALGSLALAGVATGGISGTVLDPNGARIKYVEAALILKNQVTGEAKTAQIDKKSDFQLKGLAPGKYDLTMPMVCCMYQSYEQHGVVIGAGKTLKLDIHVAWSGNLGTIGDDPGSLGTEMRTRAGDVSGPTPRMPDGKPDLTGVWTNILPPGDPPLPPMQPWAAEMAKQLKAINKMGPAAYCLPQHAVPTAMLYLYKYLQTKDLLVQLIEGMTPGHRQVYLDGRPHPSADNWNPAWFGHSTGTWDGDTLVIDSVGFNEITPGFGVHSEKLHIIERVRRPNRGKLEIDITATDPDAWTGEFKFGFAAGLVPDEDVAEWVCQEGNEFTKNGWKGRP
jgi:hypothetical protein